MGGGRAGTTPDDPGAAIPVEPRRTLSATSFLLGFVSAIVIGAIALLVFLAVSDSDDGYIELDVPAVEVDVGD